MKYGDRVKVLTGFHVTRQGRVIDRRGDDSKEEFLVDFGNLEESWIEGRRLVRLIGRSAAHFAGAVYGFAGFLTTHHETIEVGETADATVMAERAKEYLTKFGAQDVEPDIP